MEYIRITTRVLQFKLHRKIKHYNSDCTFVERMERREERLPEQLTRLDEQGRSDLVLDESPRLVPNHFGIQAPSASRISKPNPRKRREDQWGPRTVSIIEIQYYVIFLKNYTPM